MLSGHIDRNFYPENPGAEEMAHLVKSLLHKREDLSSDPRHQPKKGSMAAACVSNPSTGGRGA